MADLPQISNAEWEIMNVVWDHSGVTAAGILQALAGHKEWKEATVKTLINRLVRKGVLEYQAHGKSYTYRAKVSRKACIRKESQTFLQRVFAGQAGAMLVHLVSAAELSPDEISQLRKILNSKREE